MTVYELVDVSNWVQEQTLGLFSTQRKAEDFLTRNLGTDDTREVLENGKRLSGLLFRTTYMVGGKKYLIEEREVA